MEYIFIDITPRSTLTRCVSALYSSIYGSKYDDKSLFDENKKNQLDEHRKKSLFDENMKNHCLMKT